MQFQVFTFFSFYENVVVCWNVQNCIGDVLCLIFLLCNLEVTFYIIKDNFLMLFMVL